MVVARIEFMAQLAKFSKDELRNPPEKGSVLPFSGGLKVY